MRAPTAPAPSVRRIPAGGAPATQYPAIPRSFLSPEAIRAALSDLAEFGLVYVDSAADATAIARASPVPVHATFVGSHWRLAEQRAPS